jgi:hypothetical protein
LSACIRASPSPFRSAPRVARAAAVRPLGWSAADYRECDRCQGLCKVSFQVRRSHESTCDPSRSISRSDQRRIGAAIQVQVLTGDEAATDAA